MLLSRGNAGFSREGEAPAEPCFVLSHQRLGGSLALPASSSDRLNLMILEIQFVC